MEIRTRFELGDSINVPGWSEPFEISEIHLDITVRAGFESRGIDYLLVPQSPLKCPVWLRETDERLGDAKRLVGNEALASN